MVWNWNQTVSKLFLRFIGLKAERSICRNCVEHLQPNFTAEKHFRNHSIPKKSSSSSNLAAKREDPWRKSYFWIVLSGFHRGAENNLEIGFLNYSGIKRASVYTLFDSPRTLTWLCHDLKGNRGYVYVWRMRDPSRKEIDRELSYLGEERRELICWIYRKETIDVQRVRYISKRAPVYFWIMTQSRFSGHVLSLSLSHE